MTKRVQELMNKQPIKLSGLTTVIEAARRMREANVGAILVTDDVTNGGGALKGIVTDRDITIRAVAQGRDPSTTPIRDVCSSTATTLSPDDDIDLAIAVMRQKAIRRIPVVDSNQKVVGIVSLGDLACERDPRSVLGQISAASPNR
jgi:CBS domain-containing protein